MSRNGALANIMLKCAWKYVFTPYRWGGDDHHSLDCSGLVIECLKSVGLFPLDQDATADGLYKRFRGGSTDNLTVAPSPGCLVFYFKDNRAYHVGIYVDEGIYITADGGDSTTISDSIAAEQNAFVKIRPVREYPVFVDPFEVQDD